MKHPEFELQKSICRYLDLAYPEVLYLSDTVANLQLTGPQRARNKSIQKADFNCPDILILEPKGGHCGLFLELKVDTPFKKDGTLKKQMVKVYKSIGGQKVCTGEYDHLQAQQNSIDKLIAKGYSASFSWGFDMTKNAIDQYMKSI